MKLIAWPERNVPTDGHVLSEEDRQKVCAWYELHGVDPNTVPAEHELTYNSEARTWTVERYVIDVNALTFNLNLPRYKYSFVERAPFPEIGLGEDG